MKLSTNEVGFLTLGTLVVGVLTYMAFQQSGGSQTAKTPIYDSMAATFYQGLSQAIPALTAASTYQADQGHQHTNHEWTCPDYDCRGQITLPHRYPCVPGQNITALIHNGYDALMKPAMKDAWWLMSPPADASS